MIEFYHKYFKKSYTQKIKELAKDISRLLILEEIETDDFTSYILPPELKENISDELWIKINTLYSTLESRKSNLSITLKKYLIKNEINSKKEFKFMLEQHTSKY